MLEIANAYRIEDTGNIRPLFARLKKRGFVARTPLIGTATPSRINIEDTNKNSHVAGYINTATSLLCAYEPLYIYPVTKIPSGRLGDYALQLGMERVARVYKIERGDAIFTALEEEGFAIGPQEDGRIHGIEIHDTLDNDALVGYMDLPTWQPRELFGLSTRLNEFARKYYPEGYFCI